MIKKSAYIREFTPEQKRLVQQVASEHKIKNANDVLLFVLEQYYPQKNKIGRLERFLKMKQDKIDQLTNDQNL